MNKDTDPKQKVFEITDKYKAAFLKKPIQDLLYTMYYEFHRDVAISELQKEQDYHKYQDSGGDWIEFHLVSQAIKQSDILKSMIHRNERSHNGKNVSVAFLQNSIINEKLQRSMNYYIAFNEGTEKNLSNEEISIIEAHQSQLTFCKKSEILDVIRMKVGNLETYTPLSKGKFASKKQNCAEKKIISQVFEEFQANNGSTAIGGELFIYTKLEPCIYCVNAIEDFIKRTGIKVFIIYEELIYEIIRENFIADTTKFKAIINIISPSEFETIEEYDSDLANKIEKSINKRKNELDIKKNKHLFKFY